MTIDKFLQKMDEGFKENLGPYNPTITKYGFAVFEPEDDDELDADVEEYENYLRKKYPKVDFECLEEPYYDQGGYYSEYKIEGPKIDLERIENEEGIDLEDYSSNGE